MPIDLLEATTTAVRKAGKQLRSIGSRPSNAEALRAALRANDDAVTGSGIGVIGFCMGGGVALWLATLRPDRIKAAVPFYGIIPWEAAQPDYSKLQAVVQGHYAENDDFANPESVRALEAQLQGLGKQGEFFTYPDTEHAFTNEQRPEVFVADATALAFDRAFAFLREQLAA